MKQRVPKATAGLVLCAAAALSATFAAAAQAPARVPALKDVAPKGFRIGAAVNQAPTSSRSNSWPRSAASGLD